MLVSREKSFVAASLAACAALLLLPAAAAGFVYGEHRAISGEAIAGLDAGRSSQLGQLWQLARVGYEGRLCEAPWAGDQGLHPACFDLAAWSAMAADHSCTPHELLEMLLEGPLGLRIAAIAARETDELARAKRGSQHRNAAVRSQVNMARADPTYAVRAGANNGHFLLGRRGFENLEAYVGRALAPGTEWNALSNYLFFHGAALVLASQPEPSGMSPADRAERARLVLALESFANHFLEDMFAAGHIAGSWGKAAIRKGTHDFYNRNGLDTSSWNGDEMLLFGDAFLNVETKQIAAGVVRVSFEQVLEATNPESAVAKAAVAVKAPADVLEGRSSTCLPGESPGWTVPDPLVDSFEVVAGKTAVPYREEGPGSLPRYRAEIGPFLGLFAGGELAGAGGGFDEIGTAGSAIGSLSLGLRFGLGLEELLSDGGDGLIFLDAGVTMTSAEPTACDDCAPGVADLLPRVPARTGIQTRLRMPFWLIPGDLLLASPMLFFSPDTFTRMAAVAANGGLLTIQTKLATPIGHFQFVLGREVGATFFGFAGGYDTLVTATGNPDDPDLVIVGVRTISVEVPIIEWEPFRSYGSQQTLGLRFQLGAGLDTPVRVRVLDPPDAPLPQLNTRYFGYLRLVFEARRYF
jgi:hypothetical protein